MKKLIFILLLFVACEKEPYINVDNWGFFEVNNEWFVKYSIHTNDYFRINVKYSLNVLLDSIEVETPEFNCKYSVTGDTDIVNRVFIKGEIKSINKCSFDIL